MIRRFEEALFFIRPLAAILLLLSMGVAIPAVAQVKSEREFAIKTAAAPTPATAFLKNIFPDAKIRWFGEINEDGYFVEAKFRYDGERYSIKFDSTGKFVDAERLEKFRRLDDELKELIRNRLDSVFSRWKIVKMQWHFRGADEEISNFLKTGDNASQIEHLIEIVLRGRNNKGGNYFEVLLNRQGELIRMDKLEERNINHMIF